MVLSIPLFYLANHRSIKSSAKILWWQERKLLPFHLNPQPLRQQRQLIWWFSHQSSWHQPNDPALLWWIQCNQNYRKYGSAPLGEPAFEIQRYASNANFTVNLLHSFCGVDFYNILEGPSDGLISLTKFFKSSELMEVQCLSAEIAWSWIIVAFTTAIVLNQCSGKC